MKVKPTTAIYIYCITTILANNTTHDQFSVEMVSTSLENW